MPEIKISIDGKLLNPNASWENLNEIEKDIRDYGWQKDISAKVLMYDVSKTLIKLFDEMENDMRIKLLKVKEDVLQDMKNDYLKKLWGDKYDQ